jgi:VCBS repeat-containing protein
MRKQQKSNKLKILPLEERIMFDVAIAGFVAEVVTESVSDTAESDTETSSDSPYVIVEEFVNPYADSDLFSPPSSSSVAPSPQDLLDPAIASDPGPEMAPGELTVNTFLDIIDGDTTSITSLVANKGADGFISLREAIIATNNNAGADTIHLSDGVYILSITGTAENASLTGDLDISDDLTIIGSGMYTSIIDAGGIDRVFHALSNTTINFQNFTIQGGSESTGGGIHLSSSTILNLTDLNIQNNYSSVQGGGIFNDLNGSLNIDGVAIHDNITSDGGAVWNFGNMTVANSSFYNNTSNWGGGFLNFNTASLENTTISGNHSNSGGGAFYTTTDVALTNVTIADNTAGIGAGIYNNGGDISLKNTILANEAYNVTSGTVGSFVSLGNNIDSENTYELTGPGDLINTDPLLALLQNNGGNTKTHALLIGSPAIDAGTNVGAPTTDQRGVLRDDGFTDIGAYEESTALFVDTVSDLADGDTSSISNLLNDKGADGKVSLREAMIAANNTLNFPSLPDAIYFSISDPLASGAHTIFLQSALPTITEALNINATTDSDYVGTPVIALNGSSAGAGAAAFTLGVGSDGSTITGFALSQFGGDGIQIESSNNSIFANYIGTDQSGVASLGNAGHGIKLYGGASSNLIGDTTPGLGNLIAFNGLDGVSLESTAGDKNSIRSNTFHSNTGIAIDLNNDGITANDLGDGDTGPNQLQNAPVIDFVVDNGTSFMISGSFSSLANSTYSIDIYGNSTSDASGYGEGEFYLKGNEITTDINGDANFTYSVIKEFQPSLSFISAIATDAFGNTSEFAFSEGLSAGPAGLGINTAQEALNEIINSPTLDLAQTFLLHSNPDANAKIFLDFDGHLATGTAWGDDILSGAFSIDNDQTTFNNQELERIQYIWQSVAEDFLPFDVDVTTDPLLQVGDYIGSHAVSTNDNWHGAGGVAYVGGSVWANPFYAPAYVFNVGSEQVNAVTISHEVGHNLNLGHDGLAESGYHPGDSSGPIAWGPLQGAPFGIDLTQFSNGDYPDSTNTEDDLLKISQASGVDYRSDDYSDNLNNPESIDISNIDQNGETASLLGIIGDRNDADFFSFTTDFDGDYDINITGSVRDSNLDILAKLYDSGGQEIASSNPLGSLNSSFTLSSVLAGESYTVSVEGTGLSGHYSDYGSIGGFKVEVVGTNLTPGNMAPVAQNDAFSTDESSSIAGGDLFADNGSGVDSEPDSDPFVVSLVNGSVANVNNQFALASGALLTVNSNGTFDYDPNGQFESLAVGSNTLDSFNYTISDGIGGSDSATVSITIDGLNDPVFAFDDSVSTNEDTLLNADVFADNGSGADFDIDGDSFFVSEVNGIAANVGSEIALSSGALLTLDSNGSFSYDPDNNINGSDSFTYKISDGNGSTSTATVNITVDPVNDAPTGSISIDGDPTEDQVLSAISTLNDEDGLSPLSYQWKRDGSDISGATADSYTLGQADVNTSISVVASYIDGEGTAESVSSFAIGPVINVNDAPTGSISIDGDPTEDQVLSAISTLDDEDGLGSLSYQWKRDGFDISGATADTYTLGQADVNTSISVVASYIDGEETAESVSSSAIGPVINVNDAPVGLPAILGSAIVDQVLSIDSNNISDEDGLGAFSYQWLADGSAIAGETNDTYLILAADVGKQISVEISYIDGEQTSELVTSDQTVAVTETGLNEAPINDVPDSQQTNSRDLFFSSSDGNLISISDPDATGGDVEVSLIATNGKINLASGTYGVLNFSVGDGRADQSMTFTGTIAEINNALDGMRFRAAKNFVGMGSLQITTNDLDNSQANGPQIDSDNVDIYVKIPMPGNSAPVNSVPGDQSVLLGSTLIFEDSSLISVSDVDSPSEMEVTLTAIDGSLTLSDLNLGDLSGLTFSQGNDGVDEAVIKFKASISRINAALDGLKFDSSLPGEGSASLNIFTNDLDVSDPKTDSDSIDISVHSGINAAPVNTVPLSQSISGRDLYFYAGTASEMSISDADAGGADVEVTLSATHGKIDLAVGARGLLSYSAGDGRGDRTMTFQGTIAEINNALDGMKFRSDKKFNGIAELTITTNDLGNTGGPAMSDTDTVTINVGTVQAPSQSTESSPPAAPDDDGSSSSLDDDLQPEKHYMNKNFRFWTRLFSWKNFSFR